MRALVCALLVLAAQPAVARADAYTLAADSPRDAALPAGQDIVKIGASFDDVAGQFSVDLTLPGIPETAGSAAINGILYGTSAAGGCGDVIAYLRASTNPANTGFTGTVLPTTTPRAPQGLSRTANDATITLAITDTAFVGVRPGCLTLNLTNGGVKDAVESVPFAGPRQPPITPTPTPDPTPSPTPAPAGLDVHIAHDGKLLKASRTGVVTITLARLNRAVRGTVTIKAGKRTLGRKDYRAKARAKVRVRVRINAATRRSLARGRTLPVSITATARAGDDQGTDVAFARIQRTRTRTRGE